MKLERWAEATLFLQVMVWVLRYIETLLIKI